MLKLTDDFYDNSSSALGLSHGWATEENGLLTDVAWNEQFNAKEAQRLQKAGESLPPRVLQDGTIEDRDIEQQIKAELERIDKERPDLNFPSQLALARDVVSARQKQTPRNQGAYDQERRALKRISKESPGLPLVELQRLAREQAESQDLQEEQGPSESLLGASIHSLMAHPSSGGKHGGGRSGRRRQKKKGTWICRNCHLEYCEHRPKKKG